MNLKNRQFHENLIINVNTGSSVQSKSDVKFGKCIKGLSSKQESFLSYPKTDIQQTNVSLSSCHNSVPFTQDSNGSTDCKIPCLKSVVISEAEQEKTDDVLTPKILSPVKVSNSTGIKYSYFFSVIF